MTTITSPPYPACTWGRLSRSPCWGARRSSLGGRPLARHQGCRRNRGGYRGHQGKQGLCRGLQDSGLMPMARRMYDGVSQLLAASGFGAEFQVRFPPLDPGALWRCGLRLPLQSEADGHDGRPGLHESLDAAGDRRRKRWYRRDLRQRWSSAGRRVPFNDEVTCPCLSPTLYENLSPYEEELCDFHRSRLFYGQLRNVTQLLPLIAQ